MRAGAVAALLATLIFDASFAGAPALADASSNACFSVAANGREHAPATVLREVKPWVLAGLRRPPRGGVLEDLTQGFEFLEPQESPGHTGALPLRCYVEMVGFSFAVMNIGYDIDEKAWDGFLNMLVWEDSVAHSEWPIFEMVTAWTSSQSSSVDMFMETLQGCDAAAMTVWRSGAMQAASRAIAEVTAGSWSLDGVVDAASAGALQAALLALLGVVDVSRFGNVCTALPWILVAHLLALVPKDPLVTPAYALYFTQTALRVRSTGSPRERILGILPVVPLLPHSAKAEVARWKAEEKAVLEEATGAFPVAENTLIRQLSETVRVADTFLTLLGIQYVLVAGALMGAARHLDFVPWDASGDMCVDAAHEGLLLGLTAAQEARRLGGPDPGGLSWQARRALRFLSREGFLLSISSGKVLTFSIRRSSGGGQGVDLWICWGLEEQSEMVPAGEVVLMSLLHGPRVPRRSMMPRRQLPLGRLVVWGPADPEDVITRHARHDGWPEHWQRVCRGRRVRGRTRILQEFRDEVPCTSLMKRFSFAEPWRRLEAGSDLDEIREALASVFARRLPGLFAPLASGAEFLEASVASLGESAPPRLHARGPVASASGEKLWCEAYLWRGNEAEDLLEPGATPTGLVVRSLSCSENGAQTPRITWPAFGDAWP
eukprot:TRINITY_DN56611_c0_g1_i1.p1 TRINITY_DN56611_c0_g1~~TRINITY_DN56611_c0_g1_i1.p1  ORF type:complete len:661 (+),score=96.73 TRINITY_DN56611_c0_g1_i1:172-2154(+)